MKAVFIVLAIILIALFITSYVLLDALLHTRIFEDVDQHTERFIISDHPFNLETSLQEQKAFKLSIREDGSFTILWGTDFHLRRGPFANRKAIYDLLIRSFEAINPDLTVISGDLLFSLDGLRMLGEFADFMEEHDRLWAFGFGNHDGQYTHDRPTLARLLNSYPHALFSEGEDWVMGYSNYPIVLTDKDEVVSAIILLDSNDSRVYEGGIIGPDYVYPSQIAWYRWVEEGLGQIPLYTFSHIPLPEFGLLWESGLARGVKMDKKVNSPLENTGLFRSMVEGGNTVAVFSGHDHLNDFWGPWEGIDLHYGRSASYGSYGSRHFAKGVKSIILYPREGRYTVETYTIDRLHQR